MNKATHAWLAVEAFRMIQKCAATEEGRKRKLDQLAVLLGQNLRDVVVAAWLPDSLIKDMEYGHIFKMAGYQGDQEARFTLDRTGLRGKIAMAAFQRDQFLDPLGAGWWGRAYQATDDGGDLPNRVLALVHGARDMLKMGDEEVYGLAGIAPAEGHQSIAKILLYSTRDVAMGLWMASHYVADAHMPFHCDNRRLTDSKAPGHAHGDIEDLWGAQMAKLFEKEKVLKATGEEILAEPLPQTSRFQGLVWGDTIPRMVKGNNAWKTAVFICRASFALSFIWVPETVAAVDDQKTVISSDDIVNGDKGCCGQNTFWNTSRAIMHDAVTSIAMYWQEIWLNFITKPKKKAKPSPL